MPRGRPTIGEGIHLVDSADTGQEKSSGGVDALEQAPLRQKALRHKTLFLQRGKSSNRPTMSQLVDRKEKHRKQSTVEKTLGEAMSRSGREEVSCMTSEI